MTTRPRDMTESAWADYLRRIREIPLLTAEEEVMHARRIEAGVAAAGVLAGEMACPAGCREELERIVAEGDASRERMITANLRLVVSIASKMCHPGQDLAELASIGNEGLARAVDKFDWAKGFKFSTYAPWWIRQSIQRGCPALSAGLTLPYEVADEVAKVYASRDTLRCALGREPLFKEIAARAGVPAEKVEERLRQGEPAARLDAPLGGGDSSTCLADALSDPDAGFEAKVDEALDRARQIRDALALLDGDARQIVTLCHGLDRGEPRTATEVALLVGRSPDQVRRMLQRALATMRCGLSDDGQHLAAA